MKLLLKSHDRLKSEYGLLGCSRGRANTAAGLVDAMITAMDESLIVDVVRVRDDRNDGGTWYRCRFGDYGDWSVSPDMVDAILPDVEDSIKFLEGMKGTQ